MLFQENYKKSVQLGGHQSAPRASTPIAPIGSTRPPRVWGADACPDLAGSRSNPWTHRPVRIDRLIGVACLGWLAGLVGVVLAPRGSSIEDIADVVRSLACLALIAGTLLRCVAVARRGDGEELGWMALPLAPLAVGAILGVLLHDAGVRIDRAWVDLPPMLPSLFGEVVGPTHDALRGALGAFGVAAPACVLAAVFPAASRRATWLRFLNTPNVRRDLAVTAAVQLSGLVVTALGCMLAARLRGFRFIPELVGALVESDGMRLIVIVLALLPLPLLAGYALRLVLPSDPRPGLGTSPG